MEEIHVRVMGNFWHFFCKTLCRGCAARVRPYRMPNAESLKLER
jgi:hypothetical protein